MYAHVQRNQYTMQSLYVLHLGVRIPPLQRFSMATQESLYLEMLETASASASINVPESSSNFQHLTALHEAETRIEFDKKQSAVTGWSCPRRVIGYHVSHTFRQSMETCNIPHQQLHLFAKSKHLLPQQLLNTHKSMLIFELDVCNPLIQLNSSVMLLFVGDFTQ